MLTAVAEQPNAALFMTVAELARRDGVSKPTVSVAVKRLVERAALDVQRDRQGRVAGVNVAQYDELRGAQRDPSKDQRPDPPPVVAREARQALDPESYDEALRRRTNIEAERARLRLEAEQGKLVPVEDVDEAIGHFVGVVMAAFERVPSVADDLAAAVARDGAQGARRELKALVERLRESLANDIAKLRSPREAADAPAEGMLI